jgi:hypothetical protein
MRLTRLTALAAIAFALLVVPPTVEARPARKAARLGILYGASPPSVLTPTPATGRSRPRFGRTGTS